MLTVQRTSPIRFDPKPAPPTTLETYLERAVNATLYHAIADHYASNSTSPMLKLDKKTMDALKASLAPVGVFELPKGLNANAPKPDMGITVKVGNTTYKGNFTRSSFYSNQDVKQQDTEFSKLEHSKVAGSGYSTKGEGYLVYANDGQTVLGRISGDVCTALNNALSEPVGYEAIASVLKSRNDAKTAKNLRTVWSTQIKSHEAPIQPNKTKLAQLREKYESLRGKKRTRQEERNLTVLSQSIEAYKSAISVAEAQVKRYRAAVNALNGI